MKKCAFLSVVALLLSVVLMLSGCGAAKIDTTETVEKSTASLAPEKVELSDGTLLVRDGYVAAEGETIGKTYDLSITTFNIGGFNIGNGGGIKSNHDVQHGSPDKWTQYHVDQGIKAWVELFDITNNYENHKLRSDIYILQEFTDLVWEDDYNLFGTGKLEQLNGIDANLPKKLTRDEVFSSIFKYYDAKAGKMAGTYVKPYAATESGMGYASNKYPFEDMRVGYLTSKVNGIRRYYTKCYIEVKGVKIALYNVHLGWDNAHAEYQADQIYQLVKLMNEDEYVILGGDCNSTSIAEITQANGYKAANMGELGNVNTTLNSSINYIDNFIVSPNIDIEYIFTSGDEEYRGFSDHFPFTAYLTINPDKPGVTPNVIETDENGYSTEYK